MCNSDTRKCERRAPQLYSNPTVTQVTWYSRKRRRGMMCKMAKYQVYIARFRSETRNLLRCWHAGCLELCATANHDSLERRSAIRE